MKIYRNIIIKYAETQIVNMHVTIPKMRKNIFKNFFILGIYHINNSNVNYTFELFIF